MHLQQLKSSTFPQALVRLCTLEFSPFKSSIVPSTLVSEGIRRLNFCLTNLNKPMHNVMQI